MAGPVRDFGAEDSGEWSMSNGDFTLVAGADAVPQGVRVRLRMFLGECYLNENVGVNYIDDVFIKNPDPLVVKAIFSGAISDTPDVTTVIGAALTQDNVTRDAAISYTCDTVYSSVPLTQQVGVP